MAMGAEDDEVGLSLLRFLDDAIERQHRSPLRDLEVRFRSCAVLSHELARPLGVLVERSLIAVEVLAVQRRGVEDM